MQDCKTLALSDTVDLRDYRKKRDIEGEVLNNNKMLK